MLLATFKHISSKNADYSAAELYLAFEHDEFTMKATLDENGRLIQREDYRITTLNCGGEDFAIACLRANLRCGKNQKREDVKGYHYIISFDPKDVLDHGLTVDMAQQLGEDFCKNHFPGHQAIVCTHPDGHNGSKVRVTEREYWAKKRGQAKLDEKNAPMIADGVTPRTTKFETDKEKLRQTIRAVLSKAKSFDEFSALLLREGVTVKESRGRYSYLTPDRTKPITARKLGTDFDKPAALALFAENAARAAQKEQGRQEYPAAVFKRPEGQKPPKMTPNTDSPQRLVDIQKKLSEGKGKGYEKWAAVFNLKQMAKTLTYLNEHGFSNPEEVEAALAAAISGQHAAGEKLKKLESKITANKELMRQTAVYRKTKPVYEGLKKAKKPEQYREQYRADLTLYEAAVRHFREQGLTKLPAVSRLQADNEAMISEKNSLYTDYRAQKAKAAELQKVKSNLAAILRQEQTKEKRQDLDR